MRKQSALERTRSEFTVHPAAVPKVLSVSPIDQQHSSLHAIVCGPQFALLKAHNLESALAMLRQHEVAVVLCERDLHPGSYVDLLENVGAFPNTPAVIVVSRLADDRLWAEVLNLGAWDVLAIPFDRNEVLRTVTSGWRHWQERYRRPAEAVRFATAS